MPTILLSSWTGDVIARPVSGAAVGYVHGAANLVVVAEVDCLHHHGTAPGTAGTLNSQDILWDMPAPFILRPIL